jgi:hypothetical protein
MVDDVVRRRIVSCAIAVASIAIVAPEPERAGAEMPRVAELASPAGPNSRVPNLASGEHAVEKAR